MRRRHRIEDEQGETLLELLIAIVIMGIVVVAIGATITLSIKLSAVHRAQSTAQAFLHTYAETIQHSYATCSGANPPDYASLLPPPSRGFRPPTAAVKFWDPSAGSFDTNACPSTDPGLQQVILNLASTDGFVSESVVVVLRSGA